MKGLFAGQKASVRRSFTQADIRAYQRLSDDHGLQFGTTRGHSGERTVPGPLIGGMVSYLLGTKLPGRGTNWLKQSLVFHEVAFVGETITAEVEISRLRPEKELVNLLITCTNDSGKTVCEGEALVLVTDLDVYESQR